MATVRWEHGYTQAELDDAQEKFGLLFPPDLVSLLRDRRPFDGHDWTDEVAIRRALEWPIEGLLCSVGSGFIWRPEWGEQPTSPDARKEVARQMTSHAPKLIPLIGHRYLPEEPREAGNPVLSVFHSDVIYYGTNLAFCFERELVGQHDCPRPHETKHIPFWSDLIVRNGWIMARTIDASP
jgi:hypothetical protein